MGRVLENGRSQQLKRRNGVFYVLYMLLIAVMLLFLAACGTPPPSAHPLSLADLTPTETTVGAQNGTGTTKIVPITMVMAQSQLSGFPGGQMHMTVTTSPYALCVFTVSYGSGVASANIGIVPHTADAKGMASWTWVIDRTAHTGTWPLKITASLPGGVHTSTTVQVSVVFPPITLVSTQTVLRAYPGQNMALAITTAPNVLCVMTLNSGPQIPIKYLKSVSDTNGLAIWNWHIGTHQLAGTWPLIILVTLEDGEQNSIQTSMTVM